MKDIFKIIFLFFICICFFLSSQDLRFYSLNCKLLIKENLINTKKHKLFLDVDDKGFITYRVGIYVATTGSDYNEGTFQSPFKTLRHALDFADITGRNTIYLGAGNFPLENTIIINHDIEIVGNTVWSQEQEALQDTVITSWKKYAKGLSLIQITGGNVYLRGLAIHDLSGSYQNILEVKAGTVQLEDVELKFNGQQRGYGIYQRGGKIDIHNNHIVTGQVEEATAIFSCGGTINIYDSVVSGPSSSHSFSAIELKGIDNSYFKNLNIYLGKGKILRGIIAEDSALSIFESKIDTGVSASKSCCVESSNSKLNIQNCILISTEESYTALGIYSQKSQLTITNTFIKLLATVGSTGVYAKNSAVNMERCFLKSDATFEYIYSMILEQVEGNFFNNILVNSISGECVNMYLINSASQWINNTIIGGDGQDITKGFLIQGSILPVIVNNILIKKGNPKGIALHLINNNDKLFPIMANNLSGWEIMLKVTEISTDPRINPINITARTLDNLNEYDSVLSGGLIDINISEEFEKTFQPSAQDDYHLMPTSMCIDTGIDVSTPMFNGPKKDFEGNIRPSLRGREPIYDIGAYEYY